MRIYSVKGMGQHRMTIVLASGLAYLVAFHNLRTCQDLGPTAGSIGSSHTHEFDDMCRKQEA